MAKNLTELTSLAKADSGPSDLVHVNTSNVDYKQTRFDFLNGNYAYNWSTASTMETQMDALNRGTYIGSWDAYQHQSACGTPMNTSFWVFARKTATNNIYVRITGMNGISWYKVKTTSNGGTWSDWIREGIKDDVIEKSSITGTGSKSFTAANSTRFLLVALGTATGRCGMWYGFCGGSGGMNLFPVVTPGSSVSVSSSGNNKFTLSSTAISSYVVGIELIVFTGTITEDS